MAKKPPVKAKKGTMKRVIRTVFSFYPRLLPFTLLCILFCSAVSSIPSIFMQKVIASIELALNDGLGWAQVKDDIIKNVVILASLYLLSLTLAFVYNQLMAVITQGVLRKFRDKMFSGMQSLPIKYFDTHNHGDIMSHYTNDIDTLRQLISQSLPQLLVSGTIVVVLLSIMLYFSVWMTAVVLVGVAAMLFATKKIGGGSAKHFISQQKAIGKTEGFIEEMMNGQKVVKVFCHEQQSKEGFDRVNDELFRESEKANKYANTLGPIINNIGNVLYVIVAVWGGFLLVNKYQNLSILGFGTLSISIVIPFLNMVKQFTGNISQVSHQINSIVMGLAGASRIFELMDQESETDEGYVTLVNAKFIDGVMVESHEHTGLWAWKHPHKDGTVTYTPLRGDVRFTNVDFQYEEGKPVLKDITLYAEPGQKVAFVGATGAGKTTVTNLINRFYDIADGKIRYDGINVNKIKKSSLRKSLGIVLQETNLFTGTVMDNIRYGKLDATDEEIIEAAKRANIHDYIMTLEQGYDTQIGERGVRLSGGQKQRLSIARVFLKNPPILILDEATSALDNTTEILIQQALDELCVGRTTLVVAHRLSTIKNADEIAVVDGGRIVEQGTHAELLERDSEYAKLYKLQFRAAEELMS